MVENIQDKIKSSQTLLNPKIENTQIEIKGKINDLTHLFQSEESLIINDESIDKLKLAIEVAPNNFKMFILEEISKTQPLTNWQEWEIFKINIDKKQYIIAKKRFDMKSKEEFDLHKEAYKISKSSKSGIKVPEVFYEFHDEKNWYIIMEYIEWKTLYTLIWQEIINTKLIPLINKKLLNSNNENNRYKELEKTTINWNIELSDDSKAEKTIMEIAEIMYEIWLIYNYPNTSIKDQNKPHIKKYLELEKLYSKYVDNILVFDEKNWKEIKNNLKQFLDTLHKSWFYHRDIWWNPRNIMFKKNWNNIETYIIDFWMSLKINNSNFDYDYQDQISWWRYDNDNYLITKIAKLTWNKTEKEEKKINEIETEKIILSWKKVWLEITEREVSANLNFKNLNLDNVLSDFISWKDSKYNWFIYLTNKPWNSCFKQKEESTIRWKRKLFILINIIDKEKVEILNTKVNEYLKMWKNTREYKYATIFKEYINKIL